MKTCINRVIAYFNSQGIPFCQEGKDKPVFVLFEQDDINIFHLFDSEGEALINWSLFSWPVPEKRRNRIIDFLTHINSKLNGGLFYVDDQTGCVVFSNKYLQSPKNNVVNRQSLEGFCKEVLEIIPHYHEAIYNVAFKISN